jgi:hypothetical protein
MLVSVVTVVSRHRYRDDVGLVPLLRQLLLRTEAGAHQTSTVDVMGSAVTDERH